MPDGRTFHPVCFACGAGNPDGLRLRFVTADAVNTAGFVIDERFQGYPGIAQGGIVATILDTAMVQLLRDLHGGEPVTMKMEVRYMKETPVGRPLAASARILRRRNGIQWASAEIREGAELCAIATGIFTLRQRPAHDGDAIR